jgi:hypothetical protein
VLKEGLASRDVLRNGHGSQHRSDPVDPDLLVPSLTARGVALAAPAITGAVTAGGRAFYRIPFTVSDRDRLPARIQASVRWDPLDPAGTDPSATTGGSAATPDFGLIAPERIGDVVAPTGLAITRSRMSFHVAAPATPGRYRLTLMLHDGEGVAYDPATQAMLRPLIVRVTGDHDAGVIAPKQLDLAPGDAQQVSVWVANLGKTAWGRTGGPMSRPGDGGMPQPDLPTSARLIGTWLAPGGLDDPTQAAAAAAAAVTPYQLPVAMAPRAVEKASLVIYAPSTPGDYLLVLDILTPEVGPLSAQGVDPTIIRVHIAVSSQELPASQGP